MFLHYFRSTKTASKHAKNFIYFAMCFVIFCKCEEIRTHFCFDKNKEGKLFICKVSSQFCINVVLKDFPNFAIVLNLSNAVNSIVNSSQDFASFLYNAHCLMKIDMQKTARERTLTKTNK